MLKALTGGVGRGFMVVIVGLSKPRKGTIRVSVARPRCGSKLTRNYPSEREAACVLSHIGVGAEAAEYYLFKLLPLLSRDEELSFPPMNIPQHELLLLGFRVTTILRPSSSRQR